MATQQDLAAFNKNYNTTGGRRKNNFTVIQPII
jgi:hypothetical protein